MPKQPSLPKLPRQSAGRLATFQTRPSVSRRRQGGIRQQVVGDDPLEARAAQDVVGPIYFRIVLQELRRRQLIFEYQDNATGTGVPAGGFTVDFLITDRYPSVAIDVAPGHSTTFIDYPKRDEFKAAALETQNIRYALLWSRDIEESADRLEQLLDDILGQAVGAYMLGQTTQPPEMFSVPAPEYPLDPGDEQVQPSLDLAALRYLLQNHHYRHEAQGGDPISLANRTSSVTLQATNNSGGQVPRGSSVVLSSLDLSFTTSTSQDDTGVIGVTLEDIPSTGQGAVAVFGYVVYVRAAAGTTRGQFLRQSTTAGIAEGTAAVTNGTFGIALSNRDATLLTVSAVIGKYTTPDTGADVQTFTSGTSNWTKPANKTMVMVLLWGGGGGGGGGRGGAVGSTRVAGAGGGGGAFVQKVFPVSVLGATESVTIGAGGPKGTGGSSADGTNGTVGSNSTFGSWLTAYGGGGGRASAANANCGGGGGGGSGAVGALGSGTSGGAGGGPNGGAAPASGVAANNNNGGGGASGASTGAGGHAEYGGGGRGGRRVCC